MDTRLGFADGEEIESSTAGKLTSHPGNRLIEPDEWPEIASDLGLTTREWEVVILLFQGRTLTAIAHELTIQTRTVRQYIEQIHLKLNVQDRVELVLTLVESRDQLRARQA